MAESFNPLQAFLDSLSGAPEPEAAGGDVAFGHELTTDHEVRTVDGWARVEIGPDGTPYANRHPLDACLAYAARSASEGRREQIREMIVSSSHELRLAIDGRMADALAAKLAERFEVKK